MERKEFEQVLKRALELQNVKQTSRERENFNLEDLHSAAARLGINPEILEQALKDTQKQYRKYHLSASPDHAREEFIKHFLLNDNTSNQQFPALRIDHEFIRNNPSGPIRVINPIVKETDAFVDFSSAADGGTIVSWKANVRLPMINQLLILLWPLLFLIPMSVGPIMNGVFPTEIIPIACIFFFTSLLMNKISKHNLGRMETALENYFQSYQTLDDIEARKKLKSELKHLREKEKDMPLDTTLSSPIPELSDHEAENDAIAKPGLSSNSERD